jgi:hypothetical protein
MNKLASLPGMFKNNPDETQVLKFSAVAPASSSVSVSKAHFPRSKDIFNFNVIPVTGNDAPLPGE